MNIPVRIQVYRNNQAPKFGMELYQQTIHEGIKVTDSLVTVTAKDNDPDVRHDIMPFPLLKLKPE